METRHDAVVVGAGINGMAAAAHLAQAGWSVAPVDQHERIGGFIAAGERTVPGYRHDTYTGPVYAELGAELHRHGPTPTPTAR